MTVTALGMYQARKVKAARNRRWDAPDNRTFSRRALPDPVDNTAIPWALSTGRLFTPEHYPVACATVLGVDRHAMATVGTVCPTHGTYVRRAGALSKRLRRPNESLG